jgi:glycosyltransferase involved in cell wall biosynthesis
LFFIKPLFSKKGSSPTKLGELLACGIPVISNSGIGDCDKLFEETGCGVLVSAFDVPNYQKAIVHAEKMAEKDATFFRKLAEQEFSLEKGILCYEALYNSDVLS